jgi:hypothetical protein
MAHAAFAGWCKPMPGTPNPFERASFKVLSSRSGDESHATPKDGDVPSSPRTPKEGGTPMIWPQAGSCTRRLQLEKAAAVAAAALPQQLPAGASAFWPGLHGSDDCKSDYAESDAYASDGDDPPPSPAPPPRFPPPPPPRRTLPQPTEAKAEVEASGKVEPEEETDSTLSRGTRRQRSPPEVDLPQPRPSPAELRTPSLPGTAPAGTRNLSALARARSKSFHKTAISPRVSKAEAEKAKAEAEKRPSNYFFGESWLHQLDCDDTLDGQLSPHARGFANHHADGYSSC